MMFYWIAVDSAMMFQMVLGFAIKKIGYLALEVSYKVRYKNTVINCIKTQWKACIYLCFNLFPPLTINCLYAKPN